MKLLTKTKILTKLQIIKILIKHLKILNLILIMIKKIIK